MQDQIRQAAGEVVHSIVTRIQPDEIQLAFQALQLDTWRNPDLSRADITAKLQVLKQQYATELPNPSGTGFLPPLIDAAAMDLQFDSFEVRMKARARLSAAETTETCWAAAMENPSIGRHISSYCELAKIMITFPATSVENERHFSLMNLLKSPLRNRMGPELLNALCRIKRSQYGVRCFPYQACLGVWKKEKQRRGIDA